MRDTFTLGARVEETVHPVGRLKAIALETGSRRLEYLLVSFRGRPAQRVPVAAVTQADGEVVNLQEGWHSLPLEASEQANTIELSAKTRVYGLDGQRLGHIIAAYFDPETGKGTLVLRPWFAPNERRLIPFEHIVDFTDGDVNTDIPTWQWPLFREMRDEEVKERVEAALREHPELGRLDAGAIEVSSSNQFVLLKGHARNRQSAAKAVLIAALTTGVLGVKHQLILDDELEKAIKQALAADPLATTANIQVGVTLGMVSLTGVAPSPEVARAAEAAASRVPGVLAVRNFIVVGAKSAHAV
jgi:osmotically-inducible protein OsmY